MDLPFERVLTRRSFLKGCSLVMLSGFALPKLLKWAEAQDLSPKPGYYELHKASYYKKLPKQKVQCQLCPRYCVVTEGKRGFCRVRENRKGDYYTLAYSNPCAVHIDPMEKKPLFHFLPGTAALSLATAGCNFTCKNCQNWNISQAKPDETDNLKVAPQEMVELALQYGTPTIAYTYTEPTVFYEYMLATAKLAHEKGIFNIYHSNGYINDEPLKELTNYLDGANVDLKAFDDDFYKNITGGSLKPVLDTLKTLKKKGVWLEITNLIIPTKNDSEDMIRGLCQWIKKELGEGTPLHLSRFYPWYKLQNLAPTPVETLKRAFEIAREAGLNYVYIGNLPRMPEENTYCPYCEKLIIERNGYEVLQFDLEKGKCKFCGKDIPGHWQ